MVLVRFESGRTLDGDENSRVAFDLPEQDFLIKTRNPDTTVRKRRSVRSPMMEKNMAVHLYRVRHRSAFVEARFFVGLAES